MGVTTTTKVHTIHHGNWNLPSVKDLLNSVDLKQAQSSRSQSAIKPLPKSFLIQDQSLRLRRQESFTHSLMEVNLPIKHSAHQRYAIAPDRPLFEVEPEVIPLWTRNSSQTCSPDDCITIKREPKILSPSGMLKFSSDFSFRPISPFTLDHRLQASASTPNGLLVRKESPAYGSSANKIASNDRHKLSEKHRRDGMGAFVQAADILRKDLRPGLLSHCNICTEDTDLRQSSYQSSIQIDSGTGGGGIASKKTKNDMLEESLMWEFSIVLHLWPGKLGKHLDEIRTFASQMAREREFGLRNDFSKSKKWHADVRAEVLDQVLRTMERECEIHGVDPWATDTTGPIMTPPISSLKFSPMSGRKHPREGSGELEDDERRVRQAGSGDLSQSDFH